MDLLQYRSIRNDENGCSKCRTPLAMDLEPRWSVNRLGFGTIEYPTRFRRWLISPPRSGFDEHKKQVWQSSLSYDERYAFIKDLDTVVLGLHRALLRQSAFAIMNKELFSKLAH